MVSDEASAARRPVWWCRSCRLRAQRDGRLSAPTFASYVPPGEGIAVQSIVSAREGWQQC